MASSVSPTRTNTLALVGFVVAFVVPVSGLVLGIVARNQLGRAGNVESGAGFARWAMIIGALGTAGNLLFVVIWASFVASALSQH